MTIQHAYGCIYLFRSRLSRVLFTTSHAKEEDCRGNPSVPARPRELDQAQCFGNHPVPSLTHGSIYMHDYIWLMVMELGMHEWLCYPLPMHCARACCRRTCRYGGEEEYYVETRESGCLEQNKIRKDERKEVVQENSSITLFTAIVLPLFVDNDLSRNHAMQLLSNTLVSKGLPLVSTSLPFHFHKIP